MNAQAAQEMLDLIMLDDMVARRAALDVWTRRWVATLHVQAHASEQPTPPCTERWQRSCEGRCSKGSRSPTCTPSSGAPTSLVCVMHVVLQEPRDVDEGSDAAKRMMEMAKGERS